MSIAEIIKSARESLGLTQEDLAEKLEVSRQAVSKWELGASVPSPENLSILEEVLNVRFPTETEEEPVPETVPQKVSWSLGKVVLLILGILMLMALISIGLFMAIKSGDGQPPILRGPRITDIAFFDSEAAPLRPDLGDGWLSFTAGERVLMVVEFQGGSEDSVNAVSLFLTPTGTETFDQRKQLAVQAVADGRNFALFALDIPQDLMGHLDVMLECGGGSHTVTLNVTAAPSSETEEAA